MLTARRMLSNETVDEYFLIMKEIASRGNIENESLISYVIDDIHGSSLSKAVLYGAHSLKEFKR